MSVRRQATLYLPPPHDAAIEALRSRFNPRQFGLIRAHVTLCRGDEVADWDALSGRLRDLGESDVALTFGAPVRDGPLVYLPTTGDCRSFDALRLALLAGGDSLPRRHDPHITLVHPRNGSCSAADFAEISRRCQPFSVLFRTVTLIEQVDGSRWKDLAHFGASGG
ncbi:MAG: 2'-5' RNA ligase family protein [Dokdonella sp.]